MSSIYSQTGYWSDLLIRPSDATLRIALNLAQVQSKKTESTIVPWIKAKLEAFSEERQVEGVSLLSMVENFTINGKRITELLPKFSPLVRIIQEGLYFVACVAEMVITTITYLIVLGLMLSSEGLDWKEFMAPFKRKRDEDVDDILEDKGFWQTIVQILFDTPVVKGLLVYAAVVIALPVIIYATKIVLGPAVKLFCWLLGVPVIPFLGILAAAGVSAMSSKSDEAARNTRRTRPHGRDD